jgi:hypothetical protein
MSVEQDVVDMVVAMNSLGSPHTFRDGAVVATIAGFDCYDTTFKIDYAEATYFGVPVLLDCPLHWTGFPHDGDPFGLVHRLIADLVRTMAGR